MRNYLWLSILLYILFASAVPLKSEAGNVESQGHGHKITVWNDMPENAEVFWLTSTPDSICHRETIPTNLRATYEFTTEQAKRPLGVLATVEQKIHTDQVHAGVFGLTSTQSAVIPVSRIIGVGYADKDALSAKLAEMQVE